MASKKLKIKIAYNNINMEVQIFIMYTPKSSYVPKQEQQKMYRSNIQTVIYTYKHTTYIRILKNFN